MADTFQALVVDRDDAGKIQGSVKRRSLDDLPAGETLVRVEYSSLNYKDALSASGHPGVTRKFPHVPGIDAAGEVLECSDGRFQPGEHVLATGFDLGMNTWGGWAERMRVPSDWVLPLPAGLSALDAMRLGTAGLTAGMCLAAIEDAGVLPAGGEAIVTGASGGVGSIAVALLSAAGYRVTAVSDKPAARDMLLELGAAEIVGRETLADTSDKPLLKGRWTAAVDTVGGAALATVLRSMAYGGCVAACGMVGGTDLPTSVYPFILRGVRLQGIDSANTPLALRQKVWQRLADRQLGERLEPFTRVVGLEEIAERAAEMLAGGGLGRTVLALDPPAR